MPDFFGGEVLDRDALLEGRWGDIDIKGFAERNSREVREKEIFEVARELKGRFGRVGAVGYCFGGWGVMVRVHSRTAMMRLDRGM
jgi:dienelactone hydrolase